MTDSLDHIWNSFIQQCSLKTCHLFQIYVASALIATTEAKLSRVCHQRLCLFPHNAITVYKYIQTASLWLVRSTVLAENRYIHGPPRPLTTSACTRLMSLWWCPCHIRQNPFSFPEVSPGRGSEPWEDLSLFYLNASTALICVQTTEHCIIAWICFL